MKVGLLWYDDSQVDFATKVQEAADRYEEKFGRRPDRCYVNPVSLPGDAKKLSLDGIKVVTSPAVLPKHLWVGVEGRKRNVTPETSEVSETSEVCLGRPFCDLPPPRWNR